jgi:hypothetical protein
MVARWCERTGLSRGETLSLAQVWALSKLWYHNRMNPEYHGRSAAEAEAIFRRVGLQSDFWRFLA